MLHLQTLKAQDPELPLTAPASLSPKAPASGTTWGWGEEAGGEVEGRDKRKTRWFGRNHLFPALSSYSGQRLCFEDYLMATWTLHIGLNCHSWLSDIYLTNLALDDILPANVLYEKFLPSGATIYFSFSSQNPVRWSCYSHMIDEEVKAKRGWVSCPKSHSWAKGVIGTRDCWHQSPWLHTQRSEYTFIEHLHCVWLALC